MNAAARLYTLTGTDLATTRRNATRGRREEREGGGVRGRRRNEQEESSVQVRPRISFVAAV